MLSPVTYQSSIDRLDFVDCLVAPETGIGVALALGGEPLSERSIGQQPQELVGQRADVLDREQHAGHVVVYYFSDRRYVRCQDCAPRRHCLSSHERKALVPGRHDYDVDGGEQLGHMVNVALESDTVPDSKAAGKLAQMAGKGTTLILLGADHQELDVGSHPSDPAGRFDELLLSFGRGDLAYAGD